VENVSGRLFKGALWLTLSRLFVNLLGFLSTFVLARLLTPSDFGIVAIATSILAIALSVTDLSLGSSLVQRAELDEEHFHSVFTISLLRSLAVFVCIGLAAYPLARLYGDYRLGPVLIAIGFSSALPGLSSPTVALLARQLVFWQNFVLETVQKLVIFLGSVGFAILLQSYWALVIGTLAGSVASVICSYLIAPYFPKLGFSKFRELLSYSFWLSMGNTINTINWKFDQLVLGYLVGKAPLGIYTMADNLSAIPVRESTLPLANTLFPAFARIAHDPDRLRQAYTRAQTLICAIAMPVGFGFAVVASPLVSLALGAKWHAAIPIIQILSGTFALQSLSTSLQPLAMAKGETKLLFDRDVRTFVIRIPFVIAGYWLDGLMGVVIGRSISSFIGTIWNMALVARLSGIPVLRQFIACSRILVATAVMVVAALAVSMALAQGGDGHPAVVIAAAVTVGAITYALVSAGLWLAAGRPLGPEHEVAKVLGRVSAILGSAASHRRSRGV
jgi:O-antigen/teichoic acid export membrane protein